MASTNYSHLTTAHGAPRLRSDYKHAYSLKRPRSRPAHIIKLYPHNKYIKYIKYTKYMKYVEYTKYTKYELWKLDI